MDESLNKIRILLGSEKEGMDAGQIVNCAPSNSKQATELVANCIV